MVAPFFFVFLCVLLFIFEAHRHCSSPLYEQQEVYIHCAESEHINQHLDGVQTDLESIKEYLRNEDYTLDANTLLGLFGDIDVLQNFSIPMNPDLQQNVNDLVDREPADASGSELISYQPNISPIDFTDFLNIEDEPSALNSITNDGNSNDQDDGHIPEQQGNTSTDLSTPYIKPDQFAFPSK